MNGTIRTDKQGTHKPYLRGAASGFALLLGASCLPAAASAQEAAQEAAQDADDGQAAEDGSGVETMIVTARRREENIQDVPVAVTSISGVALESVGAQDLTYLNQVVPNVTIETSRGTNTTLTAFIRGVGQQDPVAGFEQGVGIYLDDVYLNRPQAAVLDIYDVERIEVLRGPQGTLYGRNTIGGAVKYVTKRLSGDYALSLRGNVGSFGQRDVIAKVEAPLGDDFAIGGSFASLQRNGFGENLTTGGENYDKDILAGRLSLEYMPNDAVFVRLSGDFLDDDTTNRQGFRIFPSAVTGDPVLDNRFDTFAGAELFPPMLENDIQSYGAQLFAEFLLGNGFTLRNITAYRGDDTEATIDFDSTAAQTFDAPVVYENEQFSQELQLLYENDWLTGVLGFYYLDANAFNAFDVIFGTATSFTLGDVDTDTWAIFGEFTVDLTDRLHLTFGGRYTEDTRESRVVRETFLGVPSPFFGNGDALSITPPVLDADGNQVVPEFNGERTDTAFTPRVILAWDATDTLNLYASYSEGFKGGGFDPRGNFANPDVQEGFLPERVDSFEIGAKAALFDNRLLANLAAFYADYTDVQIPGSVIVTDDEGNTSFQGTVTNAGGAEFTGVELETTAFLTDELSIVGSFGWIDAEFTEFIQGGVDISDQVAVQNTPEITASAITTYTIPLAIAGYDGDFSSSFSAAYRGDTQQFEFPSPGIDQEAYWLFDASLLWRSADGRYEVGLHGRNLTDTDYIVSGYFFPTVDSSVTVFFGNPRTFTGTVAVNF